MIAAASPPTGHRLVADTLLLDFGLETDEHLLFSGRELVEDLRTVLFRLQFCRLEFLLKHLYLLQPLLVLEKVSLSWRIMSRLPRGYVATHRHSSTPGPCLCLARATRTILRDQEIPIGRGGKEEGGKVSHQNHNFSFSTFSTR